MGGLVLAKIGNGMMDGGKQVVQLPAAFASGGHAIEKSFEWGCRYKLIQYSHT